MGRFAPIGRYAPNKFIVENGICKIECYDVKGGIKGYGTIDLWNIERCKLHKWFIDHGYLKKTGGEYLHQFILSTKWVDHISRDRADCREENLRACSQSQNLGNQGLSKNNTSGYKGVSWNKQKNKWSALIHKDYKTIHIGSFYDKISAALAYNKKALELFGEFACLNTVMKPILKRRCL